METQIIKFDGLKESQINKLIFNNPQMKAILLDMAYAGHSSKMREKILNGK